MKKLEDKEKLAQRKKEREPVGVCGLDWADLEENQLEEDPVDETFE